MRSNNAIHRRLPGWRVWSGLIAIWLIIGVFIFIQLDRMDPGVFVMLLRGASIISMFTLWVWFIQFSSYPRRIRQLIGWGTVVALVAFIALVRVERTTGSMGVELAWRWSPHPDELIDRTIADQAPRTVDLVTTSSHDFPQFLGPNRNCVVQGIQLEPDWSAHPPQLLWQKELGAGWSGFAAVNQSAVTMEQRGDLELVTCYDVETGELNWSQAVKARHATVLGYVGPRCTPTIYDGFVYALGATGIMTCLNGSDGSIVWQRDLLQEHQMTVGEAERSVAWGRAASPLVYRDLVVVPLGGTANGPKIGLIAMDRTDGTTRWTAGDYQAAYASPMLTTLGGREQILIVNEDVVSSHDSQTGAELWHHPWPGKSNMDANVSQAVPVDDSHVFLSKGYGGGAELIEVVQDQGQWVVRSVWQDHKVMKTKFSNVAIRDGFAYGLDDGILNCVDVYSGQRQWKKGRFGYGQNLLVDNLLLVLSEKGELAVVEATPERFRELGRIQALEGQTWNTICLLGGRLLVRNAEMAACYQMATAN